MTRPDFPARGQIWRYRPVLSRDNRSDLRLIVSTDAVNAADVPTVFAVHVMSDGADSLLSVRVAPHGWAAAATLEQVLRRRLTDHVATVETPTMEQLDVALRALLEL